jgi:hypothetical protein
VELNMDAPIDHTTLHRTAKYFMDNGRADTAEAAMALLQQFGLTIFVGPDIATSVHNQTALLTLTNTARRTLLAGVDVVGPLDCACIAPLATGSLLEAVRDLGGTPTPAARANWPGALIGDVEVDAPPTPCWRLTWAGWRGGVTPARFETRLNEADAISIAPALAAAACAAEAFAFHAGDNLMAGRRNAGLSLWQPGRDWFAVGEEEPALAYLPSRLWLVGLGNLGQAFAWLLATLPYDDHAAVELILQDFDAIGVSNDSTSLLSFLRDVGRRKTRVVGEWLENRGFTTVLEERRFSPATRRAADEPAVALFGVDNAEARTLLEGAGFDLVVEAGLGGGPQAFRSISIHTFPASRTAAEIWSTQVAATADNVEHMPAYQTLLRNGADACGLTQLASRTVGVPFVGLIAGCLVVAELLRRLHDGACLEFAAGSASALDHFEVGKLPVSTYSYGYLTVGPEVAS